MEFSTDPLNMDEQETKAWNAHVVGLLEEGSEDSIKQASISMEEYIRPFNREMDFVGRILEPRPWDEADRVQALDHDHPMMYVEIEPASPGAMMVDFGYFTNTFYPYGKRMPLVIQQVQTERVIKEITELGAYRYRFRQALTDLMSLQLAAFRDKRFIDATRAMLSPEGVALPATGKTNNVADASGLTYPGWNNFMDQMLEHPNKLQVATVVTNVLSLKYVRNMLVQSFPGTQLAENVWTKSFEEIVMQDSGVKVVATIKDSLVAKNEYFQYAAQNRLGRYCQFTPPKMFVKNEQMMISFSQLEALGIVLVNQAAVGRRTFADG